jgi:hypothetical protein
MDHSRGFSKNYSLLNTIFAAGLFIVSSFDARKWYYADMERTRKGESRMKEDDSSEVWFPGTRRIPEPGHHVSYAKQAGSWAEDPDRLWAGVIHVIGNSDRPIAVSSFIGIRDNMIAGEKSWPNISFR